jgi:hypothetical protein
MRARSIHARVAQALVAVLGLVSPGRPVAAQPAAQAPRIIVGKETQVSKADEKRPHAEVILAADPVDPNRLLAGSMIENPGMGQSVVAYASTDGGKSWDLTLERRPEKGRQSYADPACAFGPDGTAYFGAMFSGGRGSEVIASRDGGRTWEVPYVIQELMDRPFLYVDCTNGRFRGRVYCAQSEGPEIAVYRSNDRARTFEPPTRLPCKGSGQGIYPGQGVVLFDGTFVFPYRMLTKATERQVSLRVRRSDTGGVSFHDEQFLCDYRADEPQSEILSGLPIMAVDLGSRAFKDRLYLVWSERTEAGLRVMLMVSTDKGANWSPPVMISDRYDNEQEKRSRHHASLPCIAVNRDGVVAVSWHDEILHEGKLASHVRFRASLDGGTTWLPSVRVTGADSSRAPGAAESWLGDTAGLAADASGVFHPLWIDNRTGMRQVFTATVVVK